MNKNKISYVKTQKSLFSKSEGGEMPPPPPPNDKRVENTPCSLFVYAVFSSSQAEEESSSI